VEEGKDGTLGRKKDINSGILKEIEKETKTLDEAEETKRSGVEEIKKLKDRGRKKDCQ
jgi:hypothetical protein